MNYRQIKTFQEGETIEQIFLLAHVDRGVAKNGKPYGNIIVRDRSGQISVKLWDFDPSDYVEFRVGAFIKMNIEVEIYRGSKQAKSRSQPMVVSPPQDLYIYESARALTVVETEEYYQRLMEFKNSVTNPYIKTYLDVIFDNEEIKQRFITAPASVTNRGAYRGGLVEHTYKVMLNALAIISSQQAARDSALINKEIVIAGVLTHDLGKMYAYQISFAGPEFTRSGRLLEHLPMSYGISIQAFIQAESLLHRSIPEEIKDHINHCILAHHGQLEYGSPVRPQSLEAQIVHMADMSDSTTSNYAEPVFNNDDQRDQEGFIEGNRFASKTIFVGVKKTYV